MTVDFQQLLLNTTEKEFDIVLKEFNVTEKSVEEDVIRIKNWMKIQPHLADVQIEDNVLKRYLLCNAFRIEKVKYKIDNMYTARSTISEYFTNRDINIQEMNNSLYGNNWCVLPEKTADNGRIVFMSTFDNDPNNYNPECWIKVGFMIGDMRMRLETSTSDHYVFDCTNMTLTHASKWLPHMRRQVFVLQKCYSAIIRGVHILHCPPYLFNFITLFKSLLKKKIADRIHIHKTLDDFYKFIPKKLLPSDLGGEQKSRKEITDDWRQAMASEEYKSWFAFEEMQKSDESKRIKASEMNDCAEMQGTFRTLSID